MHELSVAESILQIVEQAIEGKRELASATVTLGPFAGICADSLKFWFPQVARERGFGEPELVVNELPARVHCLDCGEEYASRDAMTPCPGCASFNRRILGGRELTLDSVEIRERDDEQREQHRKG